MATTTEDSELRLRELVRRHRVTWESRPELAVCDGALGPIGSTVELSAVPDHPAHPPSPGCPECAPALSATVEILHRGTVNRPPDECERACLAEITSRLTRLGVQHGRWRGE